MSHLCEVGVQGIYTPSCGQKERRINDSEISSPLILLQVVGDQVWHIAFAHPVEEVDAVRVDRVIHQHMYLVFAAACIRLFLKSA